MAIVCSYAHAILTQSEAGGKTGNRTDRKQDRQETGQTGNRKFKCAVYTR